TSVIVAAFASWHEAHAVARDVVDRGAVLIGHCALETYSVLTRLPAPHRAPPRLVAEYLAERFPRPPVVLPPAVHRTLLTRLAEVGVVGGATYDALVAMTAAHHDLTLVTLDSRAEITYRRLGVAFDRIA